jgi:hypothetical protein
MTLERAPPNWTIPIACIIIFFPTLLFSNIEMAAVASATGGVFLAIIITEWRRRYNWWFWVVLGIFALIHIVMIIFVKILLLKTANFISTFVVADGFVMWGVIKIIGRHLKGAASKDD